ncbi:CDP-glycerol glycerophosphotransferase family protein [Leucobacter allii]|uniref:CDP-glycerol glycerophosphotransferase family protein n=1 Tax=Leucobacter allii TaxID=2932247 RepID=A0ABY4FN68_9MICO|nr:CDP-glycerol glycerophosphotransferase family protein [Leucobacter allii]UOQ57690.1 CDP-glycerol glycerophosphotransferase family protein [Leucobacter allii]
MTLRSTVIDFLGSPGLLPARERVRAAGRLALGAANRARMAVSSARVPGMLSIVVPMYGVERYIGECLESLLKQNYGRVQIVVVDDGSPDGSYAIARRYARRDPRVQIVRQANGGLSAARNTGVAHARGEFLAFLDSDDFVDRHAYSDAMEALADSGSDFAVMPYRREKNGGFPPAAPWIRSAHSVDRLGTTLDEFPDIMVNAVAWSKVYRRSFWDAHGFAFPVGLLYEDQALSMAAYAAARRFDVLSRVSLNWRIRGDQSSISQQVTTARNIADHAVAVRDSIAELRRFGHEDAVRERVLQIMNNNLGEFLPNIRQMDEAAWEQFRTFLSLLTDNADDGMWRDVDARKKVMIGLSVRDERELALRFLEAGGWERDHFAGAVQGQRIVARLPLQEELAAVLPERAFLYSTEETSLRAAARFLRPGPESFALEALVYIDRLRMDVEETELEAFLVAPSGRRTRLEASRRTDAWAALGHTRRYADMSVCGVVAQVPSALLDEIGEHRFEFEMRCGELRRSGGLRVDWRTTFAVPAPVGEGRYAAMESDAENEAWIAVREPEVRLLASTADGGDVSLELRSAHALSEVVLVRRGDRFGLHRARGALVRGAGDRWTGRLSLPGRPRSDVGAAEYELLALGAERAPLDVVCEPSAELRGDRRVYVTPRPHGRDERSGSTMIVDLAAAALVTEFALEDDAIALRIRDRHLAAPVESVRVQIASTEIAGRVVRGDGGARVEIELHQDPWGLGEVMLRSGRCAVVGLTSGGDEIPLYLSAELVARLPIDADHAQARVSVRKTGGGLLSLEIKPPLRDEEQGGGDRWRLRDWFATLRPSGPRSVLFRNLYGEAANDSALAVHRELQRRGSDLDLIWAVRDHSVWTPDGARVVLEESREYYEAFGTADYVMVNVHQPFWYRKPEGQVLIETFHGYPFKMNGRRWWEKLGFTAERQESFFRRAEEWDYLVSPAAYATPFLREFFRPDDDAATEVLEIGYPRNDALLDERASELREETRRKLGIAPGVTAILYAPTFRDYLSVDDMTAEMVDFLDPERLLRDLGPGYVFLLRGHPFNARVGTEHSSAFINVTDYPDINHLILASDVGVLDYSSLRFDYALTGKPTFYFVPDLERYFDGRESFAPYADTSPGPHVRSHADLVAGIRRSGEVARDFEQARQRFLRTYMELEDGRAAERLVDAVFAPRGDA